MIEADDRMAQPPLDLVEGHCRGALGLATALVAYVGEGGSGQEVHLAYHCADQSLNVPP